MNDQDAESSTQTPTKPVYERPVIVRHESGMNNKMGQARAIKPQRDVAGVPVDELVERYGSPLFVFSEQTLVDRYREMHQAFARRYPNVRMAWSYKTNYLNAVCRVFHNEGAWAEVVSKFEYDKAVELGVSPDRIHFNGPYKPESVLEEVLPQGTIIHIDHFDELAAAERVAERLDLRPKVAIRLNFSTPGTPNWTRFGFNVESGQARDAVKRILAGDILELVGLHTHMGTFINHEEPYRHGARTLAEFANEIRRDFDVALDFIDLGGGIASHNTLKAQYLPGDQATPSFSTYAEAVCDGLGTLDYAPDEMPTLVLENGRALVDDAGHLVSTVQANKRLPDGRRGLVVDAGVNILFTSFWYKHNVAPAQDFRGTPEPTVIYGPLCMNIDVVRDTLLFPPVDVGDHLVFNNVGAYNVTQWMQFITYRPNVVQIGTDGSHEVIRRAENLESVVSHEEMPSWL